MFNKLIIATIGVIALGLFSACGEDPYNDPQPTSTAAAPSGTTPQPTATTVAASPTSVPTRNPNDDKSLQLANSGALVSALAWTEPRLDNLVFENAIHVRPNKPFEGIVPNKDSGFVYQLKTDLDESNPAATWKAGVRIYEYDVPAGFQPRLHGVQGDSFVQLCWQREVGGAHGDGTQILMKTLQGNGTSAFVMLVPVSSGAIPPVGKLCP